jgi:hypothetical protein
MAVYLFGWFPVLGTSWSEYIANLKICLAAWSRRAFVIYTRWQELSQMFLLSDQGPLWVAQLLHYIYVGPSQWYPLYLCIQFYVMSILPLIKSWVWMFTTCHCMSLTWWTDVDPIGTNLHALSSLTHIILQPLSSHEWGTGTYSIVSALKLYILNLSISYL